MEPASTERLTNLSYHEIPPAQLPLCESMPAPGGMSLVIPSFYTKNITFYENTSNNPNFMDRNCITEALSRVLTLMYPLAGRLIPRNKGRYDIGHFELGAPLLFAESHDSFQDYKDNKFGYASVPFPDLFAVSSRLPTEQPAIAVQVTYLQGGVALACLLHHKIVDGRNMAQFMELLASACAGRLTTDMKPPFFLDEDRTLTAKESIDFSYLMPKIPLEEQRMPADSPEALTTRLLIFTRSDLDRLKKDMVPSDTKVSLSLNDILVAFLRHLILKSSLADKEEPSKLILLVSRRHIHPDVRMNHYLGNYFTPMICQGKSTDSMFDFAKRIRQNLQEITIDYMDSLEQYINETADPRDIVAPMQTMTHNDLFWSDWTRFKMNLDFGWGDHVAMRYIVEIPLFPVVIVLPWTKNGELLVTIQLQDKVMQRFLNDDELKKYLVSAH